MNINALFDQLDKRILEHSDPAVTRGIVVSIRDQVAALETEHSALKESHTKAQLELKQSEQKIFELQMELEQMKNKRSSGPFGNHGATS
jgi:predicted  nucleic acid-binding Zn-ribbon protein